jgi:diguanylate cyclase (GGDEF)-like protein
MNAILPQFDADNTWKGTVSKNYGGVEKVFSVVITAIYGRNRLIGYIATLHDITKLSEHVDSLTHQAHHDPLTGATNRAAMDAHLIQAIAHAKNTNSTIALFFIDLNDFKLVNDTHGHEAGDKLLSGVATNLRACLRNSDTIARFGGDEFVVIIEDIKSSEHIQTVLQAIQAAINEPIIINSDLIITAKASIGIAQYPQDANDADSLLKAADESMYSAKKQSKAGHYAI